MGAIIGSILYKLRLRAEAPGWYLQVRLELEAGTPTPPPTPRPHPAPPSSAVELILLSENPRLDGSVT